MALREKRRLCKFVTEWTKRSEFSPWLVSVTEDKHKAHCLLCRKIFPVSHGGLHDVKTHAKSKRHISLLQQQENRASTTGTGGQLWPTLESQSHYLNPSISKHSFISTPNENSEETLLGEDSSEIPTEVTKLSEESESEEPYNSSAGSMHPIAMASPGKMDTPQQYCLRWKYHHSNLQVMFSQLLERESFCDVTLACEGKTLRAHKMMLSACSTYFDAIFSQHEENNPIVILKDVRFADIKALVEFMYKGEINVENSHLSSLLKTAEELRIKGLAEVSWRSEGEGSWRSVEGGKPVERRGVERWGAERVPQFVDAGEDVDSEPEPPPPKKMKPPPPLLPHHTLPLPVAEHFSPKVTSVQGSVGSKEEFTEQNEPVPEPEVTMWEPEAAVDEFEDENETSPKPPNANFTSSTPSHLSQQPQTNNTNEEDRLVNVFNESHLPADMTQYQDVVKMNDYLANGGRRPQFWDEIFTKRVMEGIKNKELEMKVAAEILGVSYGTLYGRYRDAYGCLKHPYRVRDFWLEQGPAEVLSKLQRKELTLFRAAEMLNVTVTTLANYLSTLRQGDGISSEGEEEEETTESERLASARQALSNNPDITIVKRESAPTPSLNGNK
ncbi:uncharacterized protein LOC128987196 isoform X2 [Macrosteles quadrilineatus]|uniref:uncharacterized protein LOC128987196 isoform X2 n=1 Tax=Macrosteles quadrilineatus TaxID=74068 RepID=UPI0023E0DA64|nr:uncharacterized protein LOC128987196 isoform X2 [Macrosteles quadrilineatus]